MLMWKNIELNKERQMTNIFLKKKASLEQNVIDRKTGTNIPFRENCSFQSFHLKRKKINNWSLLGNFSLRYLFSANEMSLICSGMLGEWAIWLATRNLMMYTKCVRTASAFIYFFMHKHNCWQAFPQEFAISPRLYSQIRSDESFLRCQILLPIKQPYCLLDCAFSLNYINCEDKKE